MNDDEMATPKKPLPPSALKALKLAISDAGGQAHVADMAGISQSQVSRFLKGQDVKLSTALSILTTLGGDICQIPQPHIAAEPQADYRALYNAADDELRNVKRQLLEQQTRIMTAVTNACRDAGLTPTQAHSLQQAVMDYENWQSLRQQAAGNE
jgi:DNA-binding phage protein